MDRSKLELTEALAAMEAKWATAVAFGYVIETERDKWKRDYEHDMAVMDVRVGRARDELAQVRQKLDEERDEVALKQRAIASQSREIEDLNRFIERKDALIDTLRARLAEIVTLTLDAVDSASDIGTRARAIRDEFNL